MAYLNDYRTPSNPTNFPPIPVAAGTLANFVQLSTQQLMPDIAVTKKNTYFRVLADLTLNTTNAPWLSNVLKIKSVTTPSSTGANAETAYTGAFNGLTPGGTLTRMVKGTVYQLVAGVFNPASPWLLPNAIEVTEPTISSLNPLSVAPGDTLNITGNNLLTTAYVLVGGVAAQIVSNATTNTNVAVTVPLVSAGSNVAVAVITRSGNVDVSTLNVTTGGSGGSSQLATPTNLRQTGSTSTSVTMAWDTVAGASGYRLRRNGSVTLLPGTALVYTDNGLTAGATPSYDVQAIGGNGVSDSNFSSAVQAATTGSGGGATAPQLQTLRVEQNSPKLITAAFSKALAPSPLPMAGDFSLSSTHRILGEPLPVRVGEFLASGYYAPADTGTSISAGTSTAILNRDVRGSMFQSGTVVKVKFFCPAFAAGARVYLLLNGQVELTSLLTFGQVNTVTLPAPIATGQFDRVGLYVTGDTAQLGWPVHPGGGGLGGAEYGSTTSYGAIDQNVYVSVQCFVDRAPYFAVMGDSLIAGFAGNQPSPMGGRAMNISLAGTVAGVLRCTYQDMSWSGQTTTQMLARFNDDIIAKSPRYCFIEGGYNNISDPNVINDLLEMGRRCIAADIIPIYTGSAPNGAPTESYQPGLKLLANLTTAVKNYVNAQPAGKALFFDFGPILGDPGPVDPANPSAGPVHYVYKSIYYAGDRIHPTSAGYQATGVEATKLLLNNTPVAVSGSNLLLKTDRPFVLSDAPVSLSFAGLVNPIQSTDGGAVSSLSMQPITLALSPDPEVLNFMRQNNDQDEHYIADKYFPPNTAGYVDYNPGQGVGFVLAISPSSTLMSDFQQGINWIANPGQGAGISLNNNQTQAIFTAASGSAIFPSVKDYYRLSRAVNGTVTLLGSDDGITYTPTGASTVLSTAGLYIYARFGGAPSNTKALGVTSLPVPGSATDTGANYKGAIAPVMVPENINDSQKIAFTGDWKTEAAPAWLQGQAFYIFTGRPGSVLMRGRGRGFKLYGNSAAQGYNPQIFLSVNGQAPIQVNAGQPNPDGTANSFAWYSSPLSSTTQEMEVLLTLGSANAGLFWYDGVEWVN